MEVPWLLLVAACSFIIPLAFLCNANHRRRRGLPPGPAIVPIIGNLVWLTLRDGMDELHILRRLHSRFGPLLSVRFGFFEQVNVADRRLAHTALVERGAALADRSPLMVAMDMFGSFGSFTMHASNYGPRWSILRRNFAAEVVSPARVRQLAPSRQLAVAELVRKLGAAEEDAVVVRPRDAFQHAMFSLVIAMCFGEVLDEPSVDSIAVAVRDFVLHAGAGMVVFLLCPAITTRLFRGLLQSKEAKGKTLESVYCLPLIHARRERRKKKMQQQQQQPEGEEEDTTSSSLPHCYVDSLLDLRLDDDEQDGSRPLTDDEIASLCVEILIVGTELPATALEWIMAELVKNPGVQKKLHDEISTVVKATTTGMVSEEDLNKKQMPYLKAVVLEGLRRHPPGHQMPPRIARENVELGGYVLPKGSALNFMMYDFGMDDTTWDRPTLFMPERFLPGGEGDGVDITGNRELKMIPFGAGRRICPGLRISLLLLEYFVANLVATFEWKEVEAGDVNVTDEDPQFTVVMAKPLRARLVSRMPSSAP